MKLAVLCLCFLHLAFVSSRLFARNNLQPTHSRTQAAQSTGSRNQGRLRPLFARRGQYERQRIYVPKPRRVTVPLVKIAPTSPQNASYPLKINCSELTQSCLPHSGCCDPCATCHCHFFNAICYCRRVSSQCEKKT
ncbi:agouti-signaling protein-like [Mugil cephalus]|uniref:agouti-signaling protein-like n=1 Tax=Mugil cephalus TaxID=48193 RepID=UPI001FB64B88|nr:agouti-signaling protein-like [Mugil cephalus]